MISVLPMASAPSIRARWEIDLSPETRVVPVRDRARWEASAFNFGLHKNEVMAIRLRSGASRTREGCLQLLQEFSLDDSQPPGNPQNF